MEAEYAANGEAIKSQLDAIEVHNCFILLLIITRAYCSAHSFKLMVVGSE